MCKEIKKDTKMTMLAKPCDIPFQVDHNKINEFLNTSNKEALTNLLKKAKMIDKNFIKK